ncbi:benzoylformate decarboxylase [Streptomyces sp. ISL-11]|uniref:benzoylformate decarboxylase n=1 Tax=Streptomyces sp. ISL-11 TaxID=2819174 RepID=UPI001BEC626E|nr:benzoylformate decarboxylase [Streptomyces sp. ISL-11]MBT2387320.1 benzoylformate decarboxylase [Streptomyces sp. ISL-11]
MPTVRAAVHELLRSRGVTTVFGNPGSTELPFLQDFPDDFRYVLGLQEAVVVGMADGFAQATGTTALVNLHTAPGVGNAMGAVINAAANHTPMVVTAGQQVRAMMTMEALLTNVDATALPRPAVKWSYEPPRPQDVPAALARAFHLAETAPRGPVFVSLPMDDFDVELDEAEAAAARHVAGRRVTDDCAAAGPAVEALARRLAEAASPVLVTGGSVDAEGAWDAAVALAERRGLPVWASPVEGRPGFPENHPLYRGVLPAALAPLAKTLEGHDLVLVVGAPVFRYYPYVAGPVLPEGAELVLLTSDPGEAARAPVGDALVAGLRPTLERLTELVEKRDATGGEVRAAAAADPAEQGAAPMSVRAALAAVASAAPPATLWVNESPSNLQIFRDVVRVDRPGSFLTTTGGGLGFGLAAAVGAQLGRPERPVVAVIGDGSAQYAITALWTAAACRAPVTFVVPANQEYAILKWFGRFENTPGVPGLDLPGLDLCALARGYGVTAHRATDPAHLAELVAVATAATDGPVLIEAPITTVPPSL